MWKLILGKYIKELINSLLGGALIAFGSIAYIFCSSLGQPVLGSLLEGVVFLVIMLYGYSLISAKTGCILDNKPVFLIECVVSFIGNMLGAFIFAWIFSLTRYMDLSLGDVSFAFNETLNTLVETKINDGRLSMMVLGFLGGICIYIGVNTYKKAEQPLAKYLAIISFVTIYLFCGFEHCVDDMAYFTFYAMTHKFAQFGTSLLSVLDVAFGNIIGGMFIPLIVFLRRKVKTL